MGGRFSALLAVILWGISFVATKSVLLELTPFTIIFTRFTIGAFFLFIILSLRGSSLPEKRHWPALALLGFIGIFVHQTIQVFGLTMTTAVRTGWLIGLIPIWTAILGRLFYKNRLTPVAMGGLGLGLVGAVMVISHGRFSLDQLALPSTLGDFLILISTVNWAVYTVIGHSTIRAVGSLRAMTVVMLFGALMLMPFFAGSSGWKEFRDLSLTGWGALIFLGLGCSGLAYLLWYRALERMNAARVAAFLYIEPIVTLITAVLLLDESFKLTTIIGGLVVLLGVYLTQRVGRAKQPVVTGQL